MNALARREYSRAELVKKLAGCGFSNELVTQVVDQLDREGLQSEHRFVQEFVRQRKRRGYGPCRVARELKQRGVSQDLVDTFIDDDASEWSQKISEVRAKRFGPELPKDKREQARQSRFLQYRGFSAEQIRRLMRGTLDQ